LVAASYVMKNEKEKQEQEQEHEHAHSETCGCKGEGPTENGTPNIPIEEPE
jgi:hypothetical protein